MSEALFSRATPSGDCLLWNGPINTHGYGHFKKQGKTYLAHRVAYESSGRSIPENMQIDHLCRVRSCINPSHLEAVTQKENLLRGQGACARNARKTHCPANHEYSAVNTRIDKKGRRYCRKCAHYKSSMRAKEMKAARAEKKLNGGLYV